MMHKRSMAIDVVTAARQRIRNIFANQRPVYLSFSGGKDSLVLAHLVVEMIRQGDIDQHLLRVEFIDEEAIFPCVERIVMDWRERFLAMGVPFYWYCVEVMHYSCLNMLENDESFICWDRDKQDVWCRDPPPFAIRNHSCLLPREDWPQHSHGKTYQEFLARIQDGVHMTGVRAAESLQRRTVMAKLGPNGISAAQSSIHPIYDWLDQDVWLYLAQHHIAIPDAYQHLYQIGVSRKNLRISQFFSIDTAQSLARIAEFYPNLMERILRREPSAYIVSLYWDSEMFRRRSRTRRVLEADDETDQRKRLMAILANPPQAALRSKNAVLMLRKYQAIVLKFGTMMTQDQCRIACEALLAGDPKARVSRSLLTQIPSKDIDAFQAQRKQSGPAAAHPRHQRPAGAA